MASAAVELEVGAKDLPEPEEAQKLVASLRGRLEQLRGAAITPPLELRTAENDLVGAQILASTARNFRDVRAQLTIAALRVGELAFLSVPGELFSELGESIARGSPTRHLFLAGYSGGYAGYVLSQAALGVERYEALVSWVAPDTGERIVRAARDLLRELFAPVAGAPAPRCAPKRGDRRWHTKPIRG